TAADLLKQIEAAKRQDAKQRKANGERPRKDNPLPPITPEEIPFDIPKHWKWVKIGTTMDMINGKAFKPTDWGLTGLPIVRIQNLNKLDAPFNYCDAEVDPKVKITSGEFLISWSGTPGTSFGTFIWNRGNAVLNQHIFKCVLLGNAYLKSYLRIAINSRLDEMISHAQGAVGLQHITKGKLENMCITLPPLAEQQRIVAKVDELMEWCDELETLLQTESATATRFAAAIAQT
ncbi:MAG: restriction endonuclease subunit S, partial [Kiritimatiellales bacterium]|nr:restriction endonuclease subunit S [Kiritimatiellales bacterium]